MKILKRLYVLCVSCADVQDDDLLVRGVPDALVRPCHLRRHLDNTLFGLKCEENHVDITVLTTVLFLTLEWGVAPVSNQTDLFQTID